MSEWKLVLRQITSATDRRTVIASIVPEGIAIAGSAAIVDLGHWLKTGKIEFEEPPEYEQDSLF